MDVIALLAASSVVSWLINVAGNAALIIMAYWVWRSFWMLRSIDTSLKQLPAVREYYAEDARIAKQFRQGFLAPEEVRPKS